jgi:hypothetical protein
LKAVFGGSATPATRKRPRPAPAGTLPLFDFLFEEKSE